MSRLRSLTALAGAVALLGCASVEPQPPAGPIVRPLQSVRHGADAQMLYQTGRYFQGQVRFEQAIEAYQQVLASQPMHVDALNALGVIYSLRSQADLAERSFRLALEADPMAARVHNNLGYHLMQAGRLDEAVAEFERARELEPANAGTAGNLAIARARLGQPVTAGLAAAPAQADPVAPVPAATALPAAVPPAAAEPVAAAPVPNTSVPARAETVAVPLERVAEGVWALGPTRTPAAAPAVGPPSNAPVAAASHAAVLGASRAGPRQLEISNGNGVTGLARRVSALFTADGAGKPRLTNDKPFGVQASRIQYVPGAEAMARDINARLPAPLPMTPTAALDRQVRVRVLLGKDFPPSAFAAHPSTRRDS